MTVVISKYLLNAFANSICLAVLHCTSKSAGLATSMVTHCALDVATFNRFGLYKNSIPRGASSPLGSSQIEPVP